jgi:hypothetical protein
LRNLVYMKLLRQEGFGGVEYGGGQQDIDLDFTNQRSIQITERAGNELSPLDIEILNVVNEINRLEALTKVHMSPSEGDKVLQDLAKAKALKLKLLDRKFKVAEPSQKSVDKGADFDQALWGTGEAQANAKIRYRSEKGGLL